MESSSIIVEIPYFLRLYENGTVERLVDQRTVPPSLQGVDDLEGAASKDVVIDPQTGVFVRLYLPRLETGDVKGRVPLLVYVHGGGFCIGSAASALCHGYINKVATEAKVICVSVEYRRAPEHRLPVAYDDCFSVLEWLDRQALALEGVSVDPWLASYADFSKVFLAGCSAGANIVHQVGIRASGRNWDRLCLQGAILVHPFFGGEEAIGCELGAGPEVEDFNKLVDALWSISLPAGADRDHPFSNPVGPGSPALSTLVYPPTLVFVAGKDLLRDRGILYYESLKTAGKDVDFVMTDGEIHGFHMFNPNSENATLMLKRISEFMHSYCNDPTQNLSV
jgi:acetyl esterase/lipase